MRNKFDEQLEQLNVALITTGALCEDAISTAAKALLDNDMELAKKVKPIELEIDQKEREIERVCLRLLLQPALLQVLPPVLLHVSVLLPVRSLRRSLLRLHHIHCHLL